MLWLMIIPFANGFILRNRDKKIFEKLYKRIGLLYGIISVLSMVIPFVYVLRVNGTVRDFLILADWILEKMMYIFLSHIQAVLLQRFNAKQI